MSDTGLQENRTRDSVLTALGIVSVRLIAAIVTARLALTFGKTGPWFNQGQTSLADLFDRWDAKWYIAIARSGYATTASHAFFPGYPLLIRLTSPVFGYRYGALAVTWVAAVIAIWGVLDVTSRFASFRSAWMAAMLLAWSPVSIFFIAGYPESLLVAAMIWSLRFCLERKWWQAVILAAVASATMPQGIVSALVLGLAVLLSDWRWMGLLRSVFYVVLGELGLLGYVAYCWATTGNPLMFKSVAAHHWHNYLTYPFHVVFSALARVFVDGTSSQFGAIYVLNAFAGALGGILAVAALYICWRDLRLVLPATLLALGVIVSVITIEPSLASTARFILFIAPLYVVVAILLDKVPRGLQLTASVNLLILSALLSVLFGVMFNLGWWLT